MPRNVTAHLLSSEFSVDGLRVIGLTGTEAISRLYAFDVDVVAERPNAPFALQLLGSQVLIVFTASGSVERVLAGIVAQASDGLDVASQLRTYRLRVVPRAYRLTQLTYSEKFSGPLESMMSKKLTLCDIPFESRLGITYVDEPTSFRAQFAESDFEFISRRCEHYGVSYFFTMSRDGERMVFTDVGHFIDRRKELHIPFRSRGERTDIHALVADAQMTPSLRMVADYNYRQPELECVGRAVLEGGTGGGVIEYGVNVKSPGDAATLARVRAEEHDSRRLVFKGESDRSELCAGLRFTLDGHPYLGDLELLVTEVEHVIEQPSRNSERGALAYSNRFKAVPASVNYRPPRVTKLPRVPGVMSGIVLAPPEGPATKPWLDDQGRYRVQLTSEVFQTTPCEQKAGSMRMVQASAGPGYGVHFPLRPGTEVMLAFVNGDPDRPIILGAVPNEVTPSPVRGDEPLHHRITTAAGILMEFEDGD